MSVGRKIIVFRHRRFYWTVDYGYTQNFTERFFTKGAALKFATYKQLTMYQDAEIIVHDKVY